MDFSVRTVLVPIVLVLVGIPVWGGCEAYRAYTGGIAELRHFVGSEVAVESAFHQGWLRSTAQTRLSVPRGPDGLAVTLHHTITHGPIALGELLDGHLPGRPVRAIVDTVALPSGQDPKAAPAWLSVRMRMALAGPMRAEISSPPYRSADGSVSWAGATGLVLGPDPAAAAGELRGAIEAPRLTIDGVGGLLAVHDLAAEIEFGEVGGLLLGSAGFSLGRVELVGLGGGISARDLRFGQRTEQDVVDDTVRVVTTASLLGLDVGEDLYGPVKLELVLRNLDPGVLRELQRPPSDEVDAEARVLRLVMQLLAHSPELELSRFELPSPYGAVHATARIGIDGSNPALQMGPLFALAALEVDADVRVPAKLLDQVVEASMSTDVQAVHAGTKEAQRARRVGELARAGFIVREGAGYRTRIELSEGQLRVNGRLVDPSGIGDGSLAFP